MQVHLLGHASLFVETEDCKILIDPVLQDPFCEGLNESCHQRLITPENFPEYDFLVISHRHLDHFDLRSLAYLPKNVDVLIPQDNLIKDCLLQLGYSQIYPLADFTKVRSGSTMMMTTRSEVRVPEFGIVIKDSSGVFWNTVDTFFAPQTIAKVKENFPEIDFLLTTWHISLEGKYQYNQPVSFPYELYNYLLKLIEVIEPKAIAPGAQGFKYIGSSAWQNKVVFPLTRERFCHDLKTAFPSLINNIFEFDPGDIVEFNSNNCAVIKQASAYSQMTVDDRELVDFAPVVAGNDLVDRALDSRYSKKKARNALSRNPEQFDTDLMYQKIESEISINLPQFIQDNLQSLFKLHQQWNIVYQLIIVFPDGEEKWYLDFTQSTVKIKSGRNALANYFTYITASTLYSLIKRDRDWDYALCNGEYRTFQKAYLLDGTDLKYPQNVNLIDPIQLMFSSEYIANNNIIQELNEFEISEKSSTKILSDSMLNLGNILIKKGKKEILHK
mgnify:CR=1 FL=1